MQQTPRIVEGEITLSCQSKEFASAIASSLSPDDLSVRGLYVKTSVTGRKVTTVIGASSLGTFLATVDDLLSCVQASVRSLEDVTK
ncbi:MAG: KEOPS complex subunit Pcc1 [Candidatus Bathyarchaeia archaeon]